MAEPLRLHRPILAPLLLVQSTQQQVHLAVVLTVGMLESGTTQRTLARSHDPYRHAQLSPLLLVDALLCLPYFHPAPTGRGSAKTGSCSFTAPKAFWDFRAPA